MSMIKMMGKFGVDVEHVREDHKDHHGKMIRFQFNSKRKRMSTIMVNCGQTEHGYDKRIHMKGASEFVLDSCTHYLSQDGQKLELIDTMKINLVEIINNYAKQALRTITFAYKDLKRGEGGPTHEEMDSEGVL
jgi:Ca2+-transporting ATPase